MTKPAASRRARKVFAVATACAEIAMHADRLDRRWYSPPRCGDDGSLSGHGYDPLGGFVRVEDHCAGLPARDEQPLIRIAAIGENLGDRP